MTRDDILRMAREAGFQDRDGTIRTMHSSGAWVGINEELERFAALAAAAERDECAKVCKDEMIEEDQCNDDVAYNAGCFDCAAAIRARGTK